MSVSESVMDATREKQERINRISHGEIVYVVVDGKVDRLKYHEGDKIKENSGWLTRNLEADNLLH